MIKRAVVAAGSLGLLSLQGCYRWVAAGDSVLYNAGAAIEESLGRDGGHVDMSIGRGPDTNVFGDRTLRQAARHYAPQVDDGGWLILQDDGSEALTEQYVREIVDLVPDTICLAWITPANAWEQQRDAASTAAITAGLVAQPCHAIVDWNGVAMSDPTTYLADGVHPTADGAAALARAIEAATGL